MFNGLDGKNDGYLTVGKVRSLVKFFRDFVKIKACFESQGVSLSDNDLNLLMDRLDSNVDGKVSYLEFIQEITPKTK